MSFLTPKTLYRGSSSSSISKLILKKKTLKLPEIQLVTRGQVHARSAPSSPRRQQRQRT